VRVTVLGQHLQGILIFSVLREEKVVREEINGLDTYLKNYGNFSAFCKTKLPKLRKVVVSEMVCGFKM